MNVLATLRRTALLLIVAAVVAGCATPPDENRPGDLHCDGDRNGIPDGQSPDPWANETCGGQPGGEDTSQLPADGNETQTTMPGVLP
ncbi:MAG TPA: hypothetical protein VFH78_11035 [Candidatus Thermoplasmatota archaeon]|nr:hypothetical protein [Candidatus Thermoplasmatota archaeon]